MKKLHFDSPAEAWAELTRLKSTSEQVAVYVRGRLFGKSRAALKAEGIPSQGKAEQPGQNKKD